MMRDDIKVAAAAGLSVHLPLYWLASTLTDACGTPEPMTAAKIGLLLFPLAAYPLVPFALRLLSRYPLAARTPVWVSIPALGSGFLVLTFAAFNLGRLDVTVQGVVLAWLALSAWTAPASAAVYYFGAAVRSIKAWHRGPDYVALGLGK